MAKTKRTKRLTFIFIMLVSLIAIMGVLDSIQIGSWHQVEDVDKWEKYLDGSQQVYLWLWMIIFSVIGITYYLFSKDISESLAIVVAGGTMLYTGLLDVFFFWFSKYEMTPQMCWFSESIIGMFSNKVMGHACVTPFDLYLLSGIGVVLAIVFFRLLISYKK